MFSKVVVVLSGMLFGYWLIDDFNPDILNGKRVFITGASTGIGEQLAYQFAKYGASVVITARREQKLKEVIEECWQLGSINKTYDYIVADMNELDSIEQVVETAVLKLGGLDIIILNHVFQLPLGHWFGSKQNLTSIEKVMTVNFKAYIYLASSALSHLEKSNGRIIVVNSLLGKIGWPSFALYSSAKFALEGFFNAFRQEVTLRNSGVSVTQCTLGLIDTDAAINLLSNYGIKNTIYYLPPASSTEAARSMVRGSVIRSRQVYFPKYCYIASVLRDWIPETIDYIVRYTQRAAIST